MKPGSVIEIPEAVASRQGGKVTIQPGLPGRWTIWSQADASPGAHFVVPLDEVAKGTGVKYATVRISEPRASTTRIQLLDTEPRAAMPNTRSGS